MTLSHPDFITKTSLQSPIILLSSLSQQFFTSLFLGIATSTINAKNIFPTSVIYPIQTVARDQEARESRKGWDCFHLYLLPQSTDSDTRDQNHWLLINRAQNIGAFQTVVSTNSNYFHTLLIPLENFTFPWKLVV